MTPDPFATPGDKIPSYDRPRGDAEDRADVPRDQWSRYRTPFLDGTMPAANKGHTRVSTIKDSVVDKRGINRNNIGLVAHGIATVPELAKAAAEAARDGDKKALRAVADRAITAAGGKDRAALGTAVHDATERINRGETDVHVPQEYQADVDAYYQLLAENNVRVLPEFMERTVLCPYNSAGTFDKIVQWYNPQAGELDEDGKPIGEWEWLIADLKTGRTLEDGQLEIMIQLWLYANAYGVLDLETMSYSPLPVEVRQDKAMIIHVPMAGGVAELFVIDISGAERYVKAAVEIRRGHREAKDKWRTVGKVQPAPFVVEPETAEQIAARVPGLAMDAAQSIVNGIKAQPIQLTPQQIADAETAERRMAQSLPHQFAGRADRYCEECGLPDLHQIHLKLTIAETVGLIPHPDGGLISDADGVHPLHGGHPGAPLDGEGKPLAPLAGPGKRGCSKCGRTGHRSTSKRCLGDADPAKAVVDSDGASNAFMAELPDEPARVEPDPSNRPAPDVDPMSPPAENLLITLPASWCVDSSHRALGWTASGNGWVCPICGLPSKETYERAQIDLIAAAIEACTTPDELLHLRTHEIANNRWSVTYDEQARLKHQALSWPAP